MKFVALVSTPINLQGLSERDVKKFFKKCKKQDILKEYVDKTVYHQTKSQKRREKRRKNKFLNSKR